MSLDAVDTKDWDRWGRHPASVLRHHGAKCCDRARNWFLATARSFDWSVTEGRENPGARWLSVRFKWGPNPWPVAWCEVFHLPAFDCGVFAALLREVYAARGREAYGGQIIVKSDPQTTAHAAEKWAGAPGSFSWIGNGFHYHEIVVIAGPERNARLYDPTDGVWLSSQHRAGFLAPIAVRSEAGRALDWGGHQLFPDQWCEL